MPRSLGVSYIFFHKIPQEEGPANVFLSNILMKSASFMCECGYKHGYAPWQSGSGEGPVWKRPPVAAFKGGWEERTWLRITQARSDSTCWLPIPPTIHRFISSPVLCRIHAAPKLVHHFTCMFYYPPCYFICQISPSLVQVLAHSLQNAQGCLSAKLSRAPSDTLTSLIYNRK